jgi:hypothetical protein
MVDEYGTEEREEVRGPLADRELLLAARAAAGWTADWGTYVEFPNFLDAGGGGWFSYSYEAFDVRGPTVPADSDWSDLTPDGDLCDADAVRTHHESDQPWTGNVAEALAFTGDRLWSAEDRIQHGASASSVAAMTARARFPAGTLFPDVHWSEVWLQADAVMPTGTKAKRTFLLHARQVGPEGTEPQEWFTSVTFTIRETERTGQTASTQPLAPGAVPADVQLDRTALGTAANWVEAEGGSLRLQPPVELGVTRTISLLPVEILIPRLDEDGQPTTDWGLANELKIAKFEHSFAEANALKQNHIAYDKDKFKIRISDPTAAGRGTIQCEIEVESPSTAYNDPSNSIDLQEVGPGTFESSPQILVQDVGDDGQLGIDDSEEGFNDQSHVAMLGSEVKIWYRGMEVSTTTVRKHFQLQLLKIYVLSAGGGIDYATLDEVLSDVWVMRQVFSQVGVAIQEEIVFRPLPAGAILDAKAEQIEIQEWRSGSVGLASEARAIMDEYGTPGDTGDLVGFYVPRLGTIGPNGLNGYAIPRSFANTPADRASYGGCFFVSMRALAREVVLPHELGHVLGLMHVEDIPSEANKPENAHNLMTDGGLSHVDMFWDTKRLRGSQEAELISSGNPSCE